MGYRSQMFSNKPFPSEAQTDSSKVATYFLFKTFPLLIQSVHFIFYPTCKYLVPQKAPVNL